MFEDVEDYETTDFLKCVKNIGPKINTIFGHFFLKMLKIVRPPISSNSFKNSLPKSTPFLDNACVEDVEDYETTDFFKFFKKVAPQMRTAKSTPQVLKI